MRQFSSQEHHGATYRYETALCTYVSRMGRSTGEPHAPASCPSRENGNEQSNSERVQGHPCPLYPRFVDPTTVVRPKMRPNQRNLPVLGVLCAILSDSGTHGHGFASAFTIHEAAAMQKCHHRSKKNFCAPSTRTPSSPSSPSALYYRNPGDVIRGGSHLVTAINSPQEFAAFLDTRGGIGSRDSSIASEGISDPAKKMTDLRIVKVFASWCLGCKAFDTRYRKLANQHRAPDSQLYGGYNRVRFAEIEFGSNEPLCRELGATRMPYVLIYRSGDSYDEPREGFVCAPREIDRVREAINRQMYGDGMD